MDPTPDETPQESDEDESEEDESEEDESEGEIPPKPDLEVIAPDEPPVLPNVRRVVAPMPTSRTSGRVRRQPAWFTSGDYQVGELRTQQASANQCPPSDAVYMMDSLSILVHDDTISGSVRGEIALLMMKKLQRFERGN